MKEQLLTVRIKNKYDTAENWNKNNPILMSGEFGVESDTNMIKVGNGVSEWNALPYVAGSGGGSGGGSVIVDAYLSTSSYNPVQNKIITSAIKSIDSELYFILNGSYVLEESIDNIIKGSY